jgi:hypothetical protein
MASKANVATAYVQVVPTTDGIKGALEDEFDKAGTSAGTKMGGGILSAAKSFIGPLAAAFSIGAIVSFGKGAIDEASNLNESLNAVKVSFGDASSAITALGEDSARRLGLSQNQFNGIATQFSAFAGTIAGSGGDIAGVIDHLSTRGADFASVMNLEVGDALGLFQSGLAGETEPLRRYGIDLSAAAVEAYAAAHGIGEVGRELTEQEKVQARYGSLMEQTNKVQGDFANTADGLANSQRIANAEIADAKAKLGDAFLPMVQQTTKYLADTFVPILEGLGDAFKTGFKWINENEKIWVPIAAGLTAVAAGLIVFNIAAWVTAKGGLAALTDATWKWTAALLANPVTWVIIGIGLLVAAIVWLVMNWEDVVKWFNDVLGPAMEWVGGMFTWLYEEIIKPVFDAVAAAFKWLYDYIILPIIQAIVIIIIILGAIFTWLYETIVAPIFALLGALWDIYWNYYVMPIVNAIIGIIQFLGSVFVWLYENAIKPAFDAIGKVFKWLWENSIKPTIDWIVGAFNTIAKVVGDVFGGIGKVIGDVFNSIINIVKGPINAIIDLINGMIDGINSLKIDIPEWARGFFGGAKKLSFNIGHIPMLAKGGVVGSSGTVMVGEKGPELLTLPKGAQVTPLDKAGSGQTIVYNAAPNVSLDSEQELFNAMRRAKVVVGW